ncbi:MAG: hypothetical protein U0136_19665 [Bdellovibrionota bacterium]
MLDVTGLDLAALGAALDQRLNDDGVLSRAGISGVTSAGTWNPAFPRTDSGWIPEQEPADSLLYYSGLYYPGMKGGDTPRKSTLRVRLSLLPLDLQQVAGFSPAP